ARPQGAPVRPAGRTLGRAQPARQGRAARAAAPPERADRALQLPRPARPPAHDRPLHRDRRARVARRGPAVLVARPRAAPERGVPQEPVPEARRARRLARRTDRGDGLLVRLAEVLAVAPGVAPPAARCGARRGGRRVNARLADLRILHLFANYKWTGPADPAIRAAVHLRRLGLDVVFARAGWTLPGAEHRMDQELAKARLPVIGGLQLSKHFRALPLLHDRRVLAARLLRGDFH